MSNNKLNDTTSLQTLRLSSEADAQTLAQQLAKLPIKGSVWLSGDLGAGKTTLTRYWLQALGHKGAVKSPTYTLVEPYQLKQTDGLVKPVYHADLYRLQDPEELSFIGFDEYLDEPDALIIIEWASRADSYLPPPTLFIDIVEADNGARQVELRLSKIGQAQNLNLATLRI